MYNVLNKDFPDIVFGSQTFQSIVKIRKQASIYNFYTCLASKMLILGRITDSEYFCSFFIILILHFGHRFLVIFRCLKANISKKNLSGKYDKLYMSTFSSTNPILGQLRPFFWVNCAHFVKSWRLSTVILIYMNYNFLICHILWHFQDGRHWPWNFHMGQNLKHALISLKLVSNCLSCHKDSKNV